MTTNGNHQLDIAYMLSMQNKTCSFRYCYERASFVTLFDMSILIAGYLGLSSDAQSLPVHPDTGEILRSAEDFHNSYSFQWRKFLRRLSNTASDLPASCIGSQTELPQSPPLVLIYPSLSTLHLHPRPPCCAPPSPAPPPSPRSSALQLPHSPQSLLDGLLLLRAQLRGYHSLLLRR